MTLSAGARVFAISELVEQILLNCTPAECTRAMQISEFCWGTIVGSSKLHRLMFIRRASPAVEEVLSSNGEIFAQALSSSVWLGNTITQVHPALGSVREKKLPRKMMRAMERQFPTSTGIRGIILKVDKRKIESWGAGMWESMVMMKSLPALIFVEHSGRKGMLEVDASTLGELRDQIRYNSKRSQMVRVFIPGFVEESSKQVIRAREKIATEAETKSHIETWLAQQDLEEAG